ncbi:MAG: hypothetical protein ACRDR6_20185 [Pseudonocardiaceae bacterium]
MTDFTSFAQALNGAERTCRDRPLTVLTGATGFAATRDYMTLLKNANATLVYATSSDPAAWDKNEPGTPPGYAAFLAAYHASGFLTDADLADGYAIAHHDALVTAALAIRLAADASSGVSTPQDVISGFSHLNLAYSVPAASGTLTFPPEGGRAIGRPLVIQQIR